MRWRLRAFLDGLARIYSFGRPLRSDRTRDPADVPSENQKAAIEAYLEYLESTPPVPDDEMNRAIYGPSWGRIAQEEGQ